MVETVATQEKPVTLSDRVRVLYDAHVSGTDTAMACPRCHVAVESILNDVYEQHLPAAVGGSGELCLMGEILLTTLMRLDFAQDHGRVHPGEERYPRGLRVPPQRRAMA